MVSEDDDGRHHLHCRPYCHGNLCAKQRQVGYVRDLLLPGGGCYWYVFGIVVEAIVALPILALRRVGTMPSHMMAHAVIQMNDIRYITVL